MNEPDATDLATFEPEADLRFRNSRGDPYDEAVEETKDLVEQYSAVNVPAGVTVTFNPETVSAPGSGNTIMTIAVASGTPPGFYPMIVLGAGGGLEQTALVALTVTQ
jgi:hypothetical protein